MMKSNNVKVSMFKKLYSLNLEISIVTSKSSIVFVFPEFESIKCDCHFFGASSWAVGNWSGSMAVSMIRPLT
jgi:hypothetical protein